MKIIQSMKARSSWLILAMMTMATSCIEEDIDNSISNEQDAAKVTIVMNLPSESDPSASASTRALTNTQENKISEIDILSFKKNATTDNWEFAYKSVGNDDITAIGTNDDEAQKKFTASLIKDADNPQLLVLIANAHDIIDGLSIATKEEMNHLLARIYSETDGKWIVTSTGENSTPFPMYGQAAALTIDDATTSIPNVDMTRAIARVDVTLSDEVFNNQFKLKHVYVYKSNKSGNVVPGSTSPTIPSSVEKNSTLEYTVGTDPVQKYEKEIYLYESANKDQESADVTCIVIGGNYTTDGAEVFYRIDFKDSDAKYIDIIRNHKYVFNVTEVTGRGFSTADEAYANPSGNIKVELIETGGVGDVLFNDDYYLSFAPSRDVNFEYLDEASQTVTITTSFSKGFTIDKITDEAGESTPSWLTIDKSVNTLYGAGEIGVDVVVTVAKNTTGVSRVGYIYVTADRLSTKIKVTQGMLQEVKLNLLNVLDKDITSLIFVSAVGTQPSSQMLKVKWSPIESDVQIAKVEGTVPFPSDGSTNVPNNGEQITDKSGLKTYQINPPAISTAEYTIDPFLVKSSQLTFSVTVGTNTVEKTVMLTQLVPSIVVKIVNPYPLDNGQHSFEVLSNTAWRIKDIVDTNSPSPLIAGNTNDNLKVGTTGGYKTVVGSGDKISFTTNKSAAAPSPVTVVFQSIDPTRPCSEVSVTLTFSASEIYPSPHGGWAGSNIYVLNGNLTFDDVGVNAENRNIQGVLFTWGSLMYVDPSSSAWNTAMQVFDPRKKIKFSSAITWASWPMVNTSTIISSNPPSDKEYYDRSYLLEIHDEDKGIGDICKYMYDHKLTPDYPTTKWRMPTGNEYGKAGQNNGQESDRRIGLDYTRANALAWAEVTVALKDSLGTAKIPDGQAFIRNKAVFNDEGVTYLPAAGYRNYKGEPFYIGLNGFYWSASPSLDGKKAYGVRLYSGKFAPQLDGVRTFAAPVRCVIDKD